MCVCVAGMGSCTDTDDMLLGQKLIEISPMLQGDQDLKKKKKCARLRLQTWSLINLREKCHVLLGSRLLRHKPRWWINCRAEHNIPPGDLQIRCLRSWAWTIVFISTAQSNRSEKWSEPCLMHSLKLASISDYCQWGQFNKQYLACMFISCITDKEQKVCVGMWILCFSLQVIIFVQWKE